jgi:hypothetical protein
MQEYEGRPDLNPRCKMQEYEGRPDLNPRWKSKIDSHAPEYKQNEQEMQGLIDELQERLRLSLNQGDPRSINRHLKSGQLLGMFHPIQPMFSFSSGKK